MLTRWGCSFWPNYYVEILFENISPNLIIYERHFNEIFKENECFTSSVFLNPKSKKFLLALDNMSFSEALIKYTRPTFWRNNKKGYSFFETYNIPYQVITRGENKGKLRVKATRSSDGQAVLDARKELEYAGYGFLADHSNVFRDEDDRTVVTFSPYNAVPKVIDVPGYDVEVSDYSIYSYGTKTIVMRQL